MESASWIRVNRALSGTEISAIYSAGCAGKCKVDTDHDGLTDLQNRTQGLLDDDLKTMK